MLSVEFKKLDVIDGEKPEFMLSDLQSHMKKVNFYGSATILWQNGEIVMIRTEQSIKPMDFNKVLIQGIF